MKSGRGFLTVSFVLTAISTMTPTPRVWTQEQGSESVPVDTLMSVAREIIDATRFCALVTLDESGAPRVRAMDPFPPEENMVIWLGTNRNSRKVQDIGRDARVSLHYMHPGGIGYVSVYGAARLVDDAKEKEKRWKKEWERYYPDREATYLLIAVTPERVELTDYSRGITGDPETWAPASIDF